MSPSAHSRGAPRRDRGQSPSPTRGKTIRAVYWASTSLLAIAMLGAGIQELRHAPELLEAARRLGYPDHLLTILGLAKLAGAPVLVIQRLPRLKEWAYAGFCFDFGGAILSHTAVGDTLIQTLPALACASLLAISYASYRVREAGAPVSAASGKGPPQGSHPGSDREPAIRPAFHYRVDSDDRIRFVSAEWLAFAQDNAAPTLGPDAVLGQSLWKFVAGRETQHLYRLLFAAARREERILTVPFRCDSPSTRRFMELEIAPLADAALSISASLLREESRSPVELLDPRAPRSDDFVVICSWCKRVLVPPDEWAEVEAAIRGLGLFEATRLPSLTHGLCGACELAMDAEIGD